jgi:DNA-binding MarR family transcriptional regulator
MLDALGLYHGQPPVLFTLWHEDGLTQSELAERINRSPSTTTKTVQRMEKAGFLERRPDPEDERVSRVYLTGAGRDIKVDVEAVWRTLGDELFVDFTDEEVATFYALLQRVHRNMGADV